MDSCLKNLPVRGSWDGGEGTGGGRGLLSYKNGGSEQRGIQTVPIISRMCSRAKSEQTMHGWEGKGDKNSLAVSPFTSILPFYFSGLPALALILYPTLKGFH